MVMIEGVAFKTPIVISSCPLTESVACIEKCMENGAGGIILKTAADYKRSREEGSRKILHAKEGYWAQSTFEREIMTLAEAEELCKTVGSREDVPVIASVAGMSLKTDEWIPACRQMEKAGASMLQLDFFYLNHLWAEEELGSKIIHLVMQLKEECRIPIMPKINVNLPADFIFPILKKAGIHTVSLLDSVRVPVVPSWIAGDGQNRCGMTNEGTSFFGAWQLPLTLSYLMSAKEYGFHVIGGGGIRSKEDAEVMLRCGADAVQIASAAMFSRYDVIGEYAVLGNFI